MTRALVGAFLGTLLTLAPEYREIIRVGDLPLSCFPYQSGRPGGPPTQCMLRWNHEQRSKIRGIFISDIACALGCTQEDMEKEADQIVDLYIEAFNSNVNPRRKMWREVAMQGTDLRGGYLSHEWRTLLWKALEAYHGTCFKIAMVATYDPKHQTFDRHWISVTFGDQPKAFGPATVVLDPWRDLKPEIDSDGSHERGNWLGTRFDETIGPGGTFIDDQGNPIGTEVGPIQ